ncbi:MAG: hypothetical protein ACOYOF_00360 [Verrucomicrobiaceae bacterium]
MAKNVRLNRKPEQAKDLIPAPTSPAKKPQPRTANLREEAELNRRRMERLEMVIATAGASATCNRNTRADYLPPVEQTAKRRAPSRRPQHHVELERRKSAALVMQVSMLFVVIAAVVGWLNQRFHFWN